MAQRVQDVTVRGSRLVASETVVGWLGVRRGSVWKAGADRRGVERLIDAYRDRGYWNASVVGPGVQKTHEEVSLTYRVEEGEPTRVDAVSVSGTLPVPVEVVVALLEVGVGDLLRPADVEADAGALVSYFEQSGYPYASVTPQVDVGAGDTSVPLAWVIEPGPRVSIDGVRFSGRQTTREDVLIREAALPIGQVYDQQSVDRATRSLRRLSWLAAVSDPVIERDARSGWYVLHYAIEETKATQIEGGLGVTPTADGSYRWVGRVHLSSENLAGSGRGVRFQWDRPEPSSSDLVMGYVEPWLFGWPVDGQVGIRFEQRAGYVESGGLIGAVYRPTMDVAVRADLERSRVRPDSVGLSAVPSQDIWSLSAESEVDHRDDIRRPRNGWAMRLRGSWDRIATRGSTDPANRVRYRSGGEVYRSIGSRSAVGLRAQASGIVQAGNIGPEALIRLGGARTIRGYLEERFLAEHAVWSNFELLNDLGRRSRAYLFGDVGQLKLGGESGGWMQAVGYGAGLQIDTRTGTITVEYGLSRGDTPGQGKVHVRLVNAW